MTTGRARGFRAVLLAALAVGACWLGCDDDGYTPGPTSTTSAGTQPPSDAGPDAHQVPFDHCEATGPLPDWAVLDGEDHRVLAHCSGVDLRVTAYEDRLVRVHYVAAGEAPADSSWAVVGSLEPDAVVQAGSTDAGDLEICTEHWVAHAEPGSCRLRLADAQGVVLLQDAAGGGWSTATELLDGVETTTVSLRRQSLAGEPFYGCGEKTGRLNRRGRRLVFWNTDAYDAALGGYGPAADPLYLSVPWWIGLRDGAAYGLLTDNTHRLEMDLAAADPEHYLVKAFGGQLDQYLVLGPELKEVVRRYTRLTGRAPLPPRWALGYHQSRWGYTPAAHLEWLAAEFRSRQLPADALWLDIQHMQGFRTFTWDPVAFPDPAGLVAALAAQGFQLTVIADPGIKVDPGWAVYDSGLGADVFLRRPGGDLFVGVVWPGDAVFPDFTAPGARAWWGDRIGSLTDVGVRGVWLDVNEPTTFPESGGGSTIDNDVLAHGHGSGTTLAEVHNVYALTEAQATYEAMRMGQPDRRPFVLSRAGYAGIQRYAAVWTGDAPSRWDTLEQVLPMLLGMGLSGVPFVGSDVGGYSGFASPELFARWLAVGSISPFFRGHVTTGVNDQEPWAFGPEVEDISRHLIGCRYRLLPYLYSLFAESSATGAPLLRPLIYEFQDDPAVRDLDDQAMLGPWLLVAPVVAEGATTRTIYLPEGRWYEYRSGAIYDGPTSVDLHVTLAALPTYVRAGAIVPHGPLVQWTGQAPTAPLSLHLYPAPAETSFTLYEDSGDGFAHESASCYARTRYRLQQSATGARLVIEPREGACPPPARPLELRFRRVDHGVTAVTRDGTLLSEHPSYDALAVAGAGYWYDGRDLAVVVLVADLDAAVIELTYDTSIDELRPPVEVPLVVTVPAGTPTSPPIHVSTSANGWSQQALAWDAAPNTATGLTAVPRGEWFHYKYTRGDWSTVEMWPGCADADNRYGFGTAHPVRQDVVHTWADWCP